MKTDEMGLPNKKRYIAIMLLCLLYGGYALFAVVSQLYGAVWRTEVLVPDDNLFRGVPDFNRDINRFPAFSPIDGVGGGGARFVRDPWVILVSPNTLEHLFGGLIAIAAGIGIWMLIREKEIKKIRQEISDHLLLPEEKTILEKLKNNQFELTQSQLSKETGLSKVQVHRTINRLIDKGVLEKHKYGLTNKITMKKEIME